MFGFPDNIHGREAIDIGGWARRLPKGLVHNLRDCRDRGKLSQAGLIAIRKARLVVFVLRSLAPS